MRALCIFFFSISVSSVLENYFWCGQFKNGKRKKKRTLNSVPSSIVLALILYIACFNCKYFRHQKKKAILRKFELKSLVQKSIVWKSSDFYLLWKSHILNLIQ